MAYTPRKKSANKKTKTYGRRRASTRKPYSKRSKLSSPMKSMSANYATVTENVSYPVTAGVTYDSGFKLADLTRTRAVAPNFQEYRIVNLKCRLVPRFNMYTPAQAPAPGQNWIIPELRFLIDQTNELPPGMNTTAFEECGAKPKMLTGSRMFKCSFKPGVTLADADAHGVGAYKITPWIPFLHNTVQQTGIIHNALHLLVYKMYPGDTSVYDLEVTYTTQFRKPAVATASG